MPATISRAKSVTTDTQPLAVVFSEGETASIDYFLFPYLKRLGYRTTLVDSRMVPAGRFPLEDCRLVAISRYVSTRWLFVLDRLRRQGSKLIYFMDDDLFDLRALQGLPWGYRWKIFNRAYLHRRRLLQVSSEFWVSTEFLAHKYAAYHPVLLSPIISEKISTTRRGISVCYHGTANHRPEIEWLVPILQAVLERSDDVHVECFGTPALHDILKKLPRTSVLYPMTWQNYLAFTATQQRDLGLAPLLPSRFNAARGPTKFYDYARMGAVGFYSDRPPYRGFIEDGVDGLLLDNDPQLWAKTILDLAADPLKRKIMAGNVMRRVQVGDGSARG